MLNLTPQQQRVLCGVLFLLLFGWAVKAWRQAHWVPVRKDPMRAQAVGARPEGLAKP